MAIGEGAVFLHAQDQVVFLEAGNGLADGAGTEANRALRPLNVWNRLLLGR